MRMIKRWRTSSNPYLGIYYMLLLSCKPHKIEDSFLYVYITKSIDRLPFQHRTYILHWYYAEMEYHYAQNSDRRISLRKRHFMKKMHFKHCMNAFSQNELLAKSKGLCFHKKVQSTKKWRIK